MRGVSWDDLWNFEQSSLIDEKTDDLTGDVKGVSKGCVFDNK